MVRKNNETQIKRKKQQEDLNDSVKFMFSKFREYEKERLERLKMDARILELESKVVSLSTKVKKVEFTADRMEQYSRRNSILTHGKKKK